MSSSTGPLTGLPHLLRLTLRRERLRVPIWWLGLLLVPAATVAAYETVAPTAADAALLQANFSRNPTFAMLIGPVHDLTSAGGFAAWRGGMFTALFCALMASFLLTRHTRAEEESGRADLLGSASVGRHAPLAAAVLTALGASTAAGALIAAVLTALGTPLAGAVALGLAIASGGWVFTGVAALFAQVGSVARSGNGLSMAVLGVAYLLRAWGDGYQGWAWLSRLSPLGWVSQVRPFSGDRWVWLLAPALTTVLLVGVAHLIVARRDVGQGWLPDRLGPAQAGAGLGSALGLAVRLLRGQWLGWAVFAGVFAWMFATMTSTVADLMQHLPAVQRVLGGGADLTAAFLSTASLMLGIMLTAAAIQFAIRARQEESQGRVESILAAAVPRARWWSSYVVCGLAGSLALALLAGLILAGGVRVLAPQAGLSFARVLVAVSAQWLVMAAFVGLVGLLVGWVPRWVGVAWAVFAASFVVTFFGPLLNLPQWLIDSSPFSLLPELPSHNLTTQPVVLLTTATLILLVAGWLGIRRRDITSE